MSEGLAKKSRRFYRSRVCNEG